MRIVRNFLLFHARRHPRTFIPDLLTFPKTGPRHLPYLVSPADMARILATANALPSSHQNPLRAQTIRLALVLLYCCGLRRGELLRLRLCDFDARQNVLRIENTKFHKSRLIPLPQSVAEEVHRYVALRRPRQPAPRRRLSCCGAIIPWQGPAPTARRPWPITGGCCVWPRASWMSVADRLVFMICGMALPSWRCTAGIGKEETCKANWCIWRRIWDMFRPFPRTTISTSPRNCGRRPTTFSTTMPNHSLPQKVIDETGEHLTGHSPTRLSHRLPASTTGVSPHTVHSYRDSLKLLLLFVAGKKRDPSQLTMQQLTGEQIKAFLQSLEACRHNQASTRNVRFERHPLFLP